MKRLVAAFFCLSIFFTHAQAKKAVGLADNGKQMNPDGTHRFKTPIGLDLMSGNAKGLTIYPNAANDHILVSIAGDSNTLRHISIVSIFGEPVLKLTNRAENTFMLDVSGLRKGIYSIEVISGNQVFRKKWMRQ